MSFGICGVFFFKQKTAYEMRISDWSSDVCSSDLNPRRLGLGKQGRLLHRRIDYRTRDRSGQSAALDPERVGDGAIKADVPRHFIGEHSEATRHQHRACAIGLHRADQRLCAGHRSEEHTAELQSLMSTSYAVFCLNKKQKQYN